MLLAVTLQILEAHRNLRMTRILLDFSDHCFWTKFNRFWLKLMMQVEGQHRMAADFEHKRPKTEETTPCHLDTLNICAELRTARGLTGSGNMMNLSMLAHSVR